MKNGLERSRHTGKSDGQSGQVEAETAIVLPVVVFLLLGLIQLGLMHQARIFAKYAAYRAVRTGALYNGDVDKMEKSALAAALPVIAYKGLSGGEILSRSDTGGKWAMKWTKLRINKYWDCLLPITKVTICGPTKSDVNGGTYTVGGKKYVAFDHTKKNGGGIAGEGIKTKLRIRLVLNYRMFVPFANWVIHRMWRGEKITKELHLDSRRFAMLQNKSSFVDDYTKIVAAAKLRGVFILPIKVYYSMKLHSDVPVDVLPSNSNVCD